MKRRILSIFCALALCLTLLPATALAVEGYDFTLSEESLDFGTVSLASNPSKTVTITNSGTENIIVQLKTYKNPNTYFVLNGNPEEYEVKQDWSAGGIGYYEATVLPGDSVNVDVQVNYTKLTDTESMDYDGTITFPVYKADGSTPINKEIAAKFNWVTAKQAMEVTETSLNLGTVGQGYGDTQPVTFTITNTGQLKLDVVHCDLSFDEDQGADEKYYVTSFFKLTPNIFIPAISGSEYKFLSLEAGKTADIGVYVKQGLPQGTYRATLVVDGYNYLAETYVYAYIPLTFTVGAAQYSISADPATLDFGTAGLSNTQAEAQTVTITNTGNTVDTITLPSADNFEITAGDGFSGSTATISQGRTASFTVQPKAGLSEGNYNTAITVTSTHSASTTVNLQFKVERKDCDLMANVSQLDFGYEQEGYDQPEGKTVTLTNVGKNTLTVSLPTAENYVLEGGDGFSGNTSTIASDGTASFTVCPATGLGGGSHPAALTITGKSTSGEEKASWTVNLNFSVEPKVYAASVSPETVTFDGLRVGYEQPEAQTVTVTNTGNQTLRLELPSLENYEIQPVTGFDGEGVATLDINGKASFTVRPAAGLAQGDHSDTLTLKLTSDDPDKSVTKDVALNCNIDETALEARPASFDFGTAQGSNYQVAERLTVTISVKSDVNGEYKIKIPANDPVFIFEPGDNFVLDEDGQFYTGTVKRVNGNVTQIAAFYLSVRNDLSPGNYDRELDLGCGLTLPLRFTVEALPHEITVSPQQLDFGTIVSGVDETPEEKTLTVTNTGSNNITVNLPSRTNYVVTGGDEFEDGKAALESGAAASFTVRPVDDLAAGDYEEFLNITTDQSDVSKQILLSFAVEDPDYTISCDPASLDFDTVTVDDTPPAAQTVTITNQGNVTNTVSLPQSNTFDLTGGAGFAGGTAVLAPEGTATFTVRPKAGLSAGDYSGTLTLSGSGDSQVSLDVSYTVEKGQAAVTTAPQAKTLTYNGSAQPLVTAGTATGGTMVYSLEQDGEYTTAIPTGTNAGEYSVYYKVQGDKDHNDTEPVEVTVTIAKANYTGATDVSGTVLANWPGEVTLPAIPDGASYGAASTTDDLTGLSIEGSVLSYTGGESIAEGQKYEITVPVDGGQNYEDYNITVTLTGSDKQTLTITGVTAQDGTYNGQTQAGYTGEPANSGGYTGEYAITYMGRNGTVYNSADAPVNAGDYTVTIAVPQDDLNYMGSLSLEFTIARKALTVAAPVLTAYVGDSAPALALTYTGLVDGERVTPSEAPAFTITKSDDTEITLADAVKTAGTYTITWSNADSTTFTGGENYDIKLKNTGTLTVSVRSGGGGGSSSGSGNKTETTTNPDGSTTTTVTSSNGTVTETTKFPDGSKEVVETKKDGTVTTTTTDTAGNKTQVVENTDGTKETTITNKDGSSSATTVDETGKTQAEVKLPAAVVEDAQGEAVTLPMPEVPITTDRETAPTVTVDLPSGTSAKVEIPVAEVTPGTVAVIVKADGTEEVIKTSLTTENGVAVTLSDGDTVKVVDNSKTFDDVADNYWGAEAVDFTRSRELFAGTSATTFAPDTAMTRAMIVTVLARFEGVDTTTGSTWYEAGQQWAMQNGVSDGSNMDASLTREQLVTMFYRYAQSKGYDTTQGGMAIREYADFEQISDYAVEAMTWAVNTGIINGTSSTTLSPQGEATRAQVATILMRFIEGMA